MTTYKFAEFIINPDRRTVFLHAESLEIRDRDFDVLTFLIKNRPQILSKDEIIRGVWNGLTVEDNSVERAIVNLRKILGDKAIHPRFIKTIRGRGYLFIAEVEELKPENISKIIQIQTQKKSASTANWFSAAVIFLIFLGLIAFFRLTSTDVFNRTVFYDDFSNLEIDVQNGRQREIPSGFPTGLSKFQLMRLTEGAGSNRLIL
jgi:DNA-binding winged helix-turn-helix (wHTH) protein